MPLINGMKMACEPCIRGHRSTKCTHANERLMVPVRKPGRPLSVCPHPPQQACGCGSVTAAIPRKQTCHCGSNTQAQSAAAHNGAPGPGKSRSSSFDRAGGPPMPPEAPSPTKVAFKVQKSSLKQSSGRRQSFDPVNFERMNMSQVNMLPYEQRSQNIPVSMPNGYTMTGPPQGYRFEPQFANMQPQYSHVSMQPPPNPNGMSGNGVHASSTNGYTNGMNGNGSLEHVIESPLAMPTTYGSRDSGKFINGGPYGSPDTINGETQAVTNGGSCCAPNQKTHSHTSSISSISDSEGTAQRSCCAPKPKPKLKQEPASNGGSVHAAPHMTPQMLPQNNIMAFNTAAYPQYGPQPTVFTYPATYGSFQNPLQPSAWRESVRSNNYSQVPLPPGSLPFDAPLVPENLDTVHTCSCGDGCQCIGCAAHPYNDASREYVWSAWASMNSEGSASELYNNPQAPTNGNISSQPPPVNTIPSPTAHTPSSTTSGNDEEQTLSAADFFFVNYPFTSDGCGGDRQSCPCGDDCQCLGCTIHRQPAIPCGGEEESCPCEADCQCIGCSIHGNATAV